MPQRTGLRHFYSGILYAVRRTFIAVLTFVLIATYALARAEAVQQSPQAQPAPPAAAQQTPPSTTSAAPAAPPSAAPAQSAPQTSPTPSPQRGLTLVVLDPAHGGTDLGAHGGSGINESDVVLMFARLLRISLEAQGFRVVLTRTANETVSFEDRSRIANAQRGAVFISLHVSSTGPAGTARVYCLPQPDLATETAPAPTARTALIPWDRAQQGFLIPSRELAEIVQTQLAQRFQGSPAAPIPANVRQLRTIAEPAIAVEVSSVSLPDRTVLDQMGPTLADGIARGVAAFRPFYAEGAR